MSKNGNGNAGGNIILASKQQRKITGLTGWTLGLIGIALAFVLFEFVSRYNAPVESDRSFGEQCFKYFWFAVGLPIYAGFAYAKIAPQFALVPPKFFGGDKIFLQFLLGSALSFVAQAIMNFLVMPVTAVIGIIELYLFYASAAILEECLFRMGLQQVLYHVLLKARRVKNGREDYAVSGTVAVITGSVIFGISHWEVYAKTPVLILGMVLLGISFGVVMLISNNLLVPILVHVMNNIGATIAKQASGEIGMNGGDPANIFIVILVNCIVISICLLIKRKKSDNEKVSMQESMSNEIQVEDPAIKAKRLKLILILAGISVVLFIILFVTGYYVNFKVIFDI